MPEIERESELKKKNNQTLSVKSASKSMREY